MNAASPKKKARPNLRDTARLVPARYQILKFLGAGASSQVWKVADRFANDEIKAAKVIWLNGPDNPAAQREQIASEFLMAARFAHPNLVQYFDLHLRPDSECAVVTMEYVPGQQLVSEVRLDMDTAGRLFLHLLRALQLLHEAGYVHGDVKPANVLWGGGNGPFVVKLLDYHLTYRPHDLNYHTSRGTLRYLAPEAISGEPVDGRSDLYSAGVMFYELLSGESLFTGPPRAVAGKHMTAPVPHLKLRDARIGLLDRFVGRMLAKAPVARYASANEAALELVRILNLPETHETPATLAARIRSAPLVGREETIRTISEALNKAYAAECPTVLHIHGGAGVGKSRLLSEAIRLAQARGYLTVRLPTESGGAPLIEAMGRAVGERGASCGLRDDRKEELAPEGLLGLSPATLAQLTKLADALSGHARRHAMLIAFDDLHAASSDIVEAFAFLTRSLRKAPVCWCFTTCDGGDSAATRDLLGGISGEVVHVLVEELDEAGQRTLIASSLPKGTPTPIRKSIMEQCGGTPAVIVGTIEHLISSGILCCDEEGHVRLQREIDDVLPGNLDELLSTVLNDLPCELRETLELLSVAAGETSLSSLADAIGLPPEALREMIVGNRAAMIISCRAAKKGTLCRFQHAAFRGRVENQLSAARAKTLHDKLASALSRSQGSMNWAVARHQLLGNHPRAGVHVVMELLKSKTPSVRNEAAGILATCQKYARGAERPVILEATADAQAVRGQDAEAVKAYGQALAHNTVGEVQSLRLLRKLALLHLRQGRIADAQSVLDEATGHGEAVAKYPREQALIRLAQAEVLFGQSRFDEAIAVSNETYALGKRLADESLMTQALLTCGKALNRAGKENESPRTLVRALWHARRAHDGVMVGKVLAALGNAAMFLGRPVHAFQYLERSARMMNQLGQIQDAAWILMTLGNNHQRLGNWDLAIQNYTEAADSYERLNLAEGRVRVLGNLSSVYASSGRLGEAIAVAQEAATLCVSDTALNCAILLRLARAQFMLGDLTGAGATAIQFHARADAAHLDNMLEAGHRLLGEIAMLRGEFKKAEHYLRAALAISATLKSALRQAIAHARLSELLIACGKEAEGLGHAEAALRYAETSQDVGVLAVAQTSRGKAASAASDSDDALRWFRQAEHIISKEQVWDEFMEVSLCLARIYESRGQMRFAASCLRSAVDAMDHVLAHLKNPEQRGIFLQDPRRRALLQAVTEFGEKVSRQQGMIEGDSSHG